MAAADVTDDTELFADGDVVEADDDLRADAVDAAELFRLPEFSDFAGPASVPFTSFSASGASEISGTGGGVFPASKADLMAAKFLNAPTGFLAAAAADVCGRFELSGLSGFDSKMEILSEMGLFPD